MAIEKEDKSVTSTIDEKVEKAIKSPIVGDVMFTDEEFSELGEMVSNVCPSRIVNDHTFAKRLFVYIVNLTQRRCKKNLRWNFTDNVCREVIEAYSMKDYYECMSTLFNVLTDEVFIVHEHGATLYRTTFMYHALVPDSSMQSFFEYCWNLYFDKFNFNKQYIENDAIYLGMAETFANRYLHVNVFYNSDDKVEKSISFKFIGRSYNFRIGLIVMGRKRPEVFAGLFKMFIHQIDQLYHGQDIDINNQYLNQLICEYYQKTVENMATQEITPRGPKVRQNTDDDTDTGESKENGFRSVPNIYYKLINKRIYLVISRYGFDHYVDGNKVIDYELMYKNEEIGRGQIKMDRYAQSAFCVTHREEIDVTEMLQKCPDLIKYITVIIGDPDDKNVRTPNGGGKRDLLLFPYSNYTIENFKKSVKPAYYYLFMPELDSSNVGSNAQIIWQNFLLINLNNDTFLGGPYNSVYVDAGIYDKPYFVNRNRRADFKYKGELFDITSDLILRVDASVLDTQFTVHIRNFDDSSDVTFYNLVDCIESSLNTLNYRILHLNPELRENVPYVVSLVDTHNTEICIQNIINIPGFRIEYEKYLYIDEDVKYRIITTDHAPIDGKFSYDFGDEVTIPYGNGEIVVIDPPVLRVSTDGKSYVPISKFPVTMLADDMKNISFTFRPFYIHVEMRLDRDYDIYPAHIYQYLSSYKEHHPDVVKKQIFLFINKDNNNPIALTEVYFKYAFSTCPLYADGNNIQWYPLHFYGPENITKFIVHFYIKDVYICSSPTLGRVPEVIVINTNLSSGMYTYKVCYIDSSNDEFLAYTDTIFLGNDKDQSSFFASVKFDYVTLHDYKPRLYAAPTKDKRLTTTYSIEFSKPIYDENNEIKYYIGQLCMTPKNERIIVRRSGTIIIDGIVWRKYQDDPEYEIEIRYMLESDPINDDFECYHKLALAKYADVIVAVDNISEKSDIMYEIVKATRKNQ